jgi:hypothetical protein
MQRFVRTFSKGHNGLHERKDVFDSVKRKLKERLSEHQLATWRSWFAEPLGALYAHNLRRLAEIYGSDKWAHHWYCQHYARHFAHLRKRRIVLLEIGIGGYGVARLGGSSLRMWRRYFPYGRIYGIDLADKSPHNERRIQTFQGDQSDEKFLGEVIADIGRPDIIIDDGSHLNPHVIKTFQTLFPLLADQGIYAVEDTQTSYWPVFGGNSKDLKDPATSMNMFKTLIDGLNHAEFEQPGFVPSYFDQHIVAMHFYHNLVVVCKGSNDEGSYK